MSSRGLEIQKSRKMDIRVIAATNRDLETLMKEKLFRDDLFYRLDVFRIYLPPLRDRTEDIPLLANYFLDVFAKNMHKNIRGFSPEAMALLKEHNWPGNVRELKNMLERLDYHDRRVHRAYVGGCLRHR